MHHVYGRGDHYGRGYVFDMDVWLRKDGHMLARFWSRSAMVDSLSIELIGFSRLQSLPKRGSRGTELDEGWVPWCLRSEYSAWIDEQSDYIREKIY
jgi:hypothetical protein